MMVMMMTLKLFTRKHVPLSSINLNSKFRVDQKAVTHCWEDNGASHTGH